MAKKQLSEEEKFARGLGNLQYAAYATGAAILVHTFIYDFGAYVNIVAFVLAIACFTAGVYAPRRDETGLHAVRVFVGILYVFGLFMILFIFWLSIFIIIAVLIWRKPITKYYTKAYREQYITTQ